VLSGSVKLISNFESVSVGHVEIYAFTHGDVTSTKAVTLFTQIAPLTISHTYSHLYFSTPPYRSHAVSQQYCPRMGRISTLCRDSTSVTQIKLCTAMYTSPYEARTLQFEALGGHQALAKSVSNSLLVAFVVFDVEYSILPNE
jgi:hypothetical protein